MRDLSILGLGATTTGLLFCISCGGSAPASICGSERPCLPEGTWTVSYEMASSGQTFSPSTIRIDADGAEVVGEEVPDNACTPQDPTPGDLTTGAELSSDGCTLTAEISKSWCQSGEDNCEERRITLDFCDNGSSTVATGSLEACDCWLTGGPFCNTDSDYVTVGASATRTPL